MKSISNLRLDKYKVIIFDLDGTLMDSIGMWNEIDQQLIYHFSGQVINLDTIQRQRDAFIKDFAGGKNDDLYLNYGGYLNDLYNFNSTAEKIWDYRYKTAAIFLSETLDYKPNAEILLKYLKQKKFTLVLATNSIQRALNLLKENKNFKLKADFDKTFDLMISSSDITRRKPNPEIYLKILQHFNVKSEQCITFEDALDGVTAAKAAGIEVVNVYDKYSDAERAEIDKITDYKINNFSEILKLIK